MEIVKVDSERAQAYLRLCQAYEAEFSAITGKRPDAQGLFALDTQLGGDVVGYMLYQQRAPVGLAAVRVGAGGAAHEVCEFYIVPSCRRQGLGRRLAGALFALHPGRWEVKQIHGAERATAFWRRAIGELTGGAFEEDIYQDAYWGVVTRQRFTLS